MTERDRKEYQGYLRGLNDVSLGCTQTIRLRELHRTEAVLQDVREEVQMIEAEVRARMDALPRSLRQEPMKVIDTKKEPIR